MGTGSSKGENRGREAAEQAIKSPLLDNVSIKGARGVLFNITGGKDLGLFDIDQAATLIHEEVGNDANIIFGAVIDKELSDEVRVTVIATGFNSSLSDESILDEEGDETIVDFISRSADVMAVGKAVREAAGYGNGDQRQHIIEDGIVSTYDGSNLNTPTFMRRQAD